MVIKKYQANTETEAILLAKEELGKDAIVMNIKKISPKGIYKLFRKPLVEITAASDETVNYQSDKMKSDLFGSYQSDREKTDSSFGGTFNMTMASNATMKSPTIPDLTKIQSKPNLHKDIIVEDKEKEQTSALEAKLNNLQLLLEKQLQDKSPVTKDKDEKQNEPDKNVTYLQLIYGQLITNEVDEKYVNQIISEIETTLSKDASMDNILASVYQKIVLKLGQAKGIEVDKDKQKVIFFIGPTGVGKTTTIAKVASRLKMQDKAKVALLTADTYRIAAVDQLRTYANILGIPMKVIYSSEEMKDAKEEFSDYDLILIDTAGRSHRNIEQRADLDELIHSVDEDQRETYLVLSATTKYNDLIKITETYSDIVDYRLLFTKLDETICLGNLLNIRMLTNAFLSYGAFGQNVPDDISKIDAQDIAKQLLRGQ